MVHNGGMFLRSSQMPDSAPGQDHAPRVSERVAGEILSRIASGEWQPGYRLPGERQLAEDMGVSRVSIRAALQSLKARGLVDAVQGGGTRVVAAPGCGVDDSLLQLVRINQDNLADLAEIRGILEVWAVRRAAARATVQDIEDLESVLAQTDAYATDSRRKAHYDGRFHFAIAKATGSTLYLHLMTSLRDKLRQMQEHHRLTLFSSEQDDHTIRSHHLAVFEAIRDHDVHGAAMAMQLHMDWVVSRYRQDCHLR